MALDEQGCSLERGQFMSGACASSVRSNCSPFRSTSWPEVFCCISPLWVYCILVPPPNASLSMESSTLRVGRGVKRVAPHRDDRERVAITGMEHTQCPGKSPEEVWAASLAMKSGITLVPPSRRDYVLFYDPRPQVPDSTIKVGAFLDFHISQRNSGIPPHDFRTMTEATRITMWLADRAIRASYLAFGHPARTNRSPHLRNG